MTYLSSHEQTSGNIAVSTVDHVSGNVAVGNSGNHPRSTSSRSMGNVPFRSGDGQVHLGHSPVLSCFFPLVSIFFLAQNRHFQHETSSVSPMRQQGGLATTSVSLCYHLPTVFQPNIEQTMSLDIRDAHRKRRLCNRERYPTSSPEESQPQHQEYVWFGLHQSDGVSFTYSAGRLRLREQDHRRVHQVDRSIPHPG